MDESLAVYDLGPLLFELESCGVRPSPDLGFEIQKLRCVGKTMSLLFPLYALGALAIVIPIYLHLQRRPPSETVEFSSLAFLKPSKKIRVNRKSKLEHLPLLLLRCLALLFLAFMFARPFMNDPDALAAGEGERAILLVDTSASMRRAGLWEEAKTRIDKLLNDVDPDKDRLAILAFNDGFDSLLDFEQWAAAPASERLAIARAALEPLEPTWRASNLGRVLAEANDVLQDDGGQPQRSFIYLVSDMQEGAELDELANTEWPEDLPLVPQLIEADDPANASLHLFPERVSRLRLANDSPEADEFHLAWVGSTNRQSIVLEPGAVRIFALPDGQPAQGGELKIEGDAEPFDNRAFVAPPAALPVQLQVLGPRSANDPDGLFYYFERAFPKTGTLAPSFPEPATFLADPERADLLVITEALEASTRDLVREQLLAGRRAVMVLTSVRSVPTLASLLNVPELNASEAKIDDYALFQDLDFEHPALGAFTVPAVRDFTNVHVWHYRKLDPTEFPDGTHILASFDRGDRGSSDPAWLDIPVGKGRLLVLAAGWHPRDSQLARSSKFLPLCFSLLEYAGRNTEVETALAIGDALPWRDHLQSRTATLTTPDGKTRSLPLGQGVARADLPGLYHVEAEGRSVTYAANLVPSESRLAPLAADRFRSLGIPYGKGAASQRSRAEVEAAAKNLARSDVEARQRLWRWIVLALFLILVVETFLSGRTRVAEEA